MHEADASHCNITLPETLSAVANRPIRANLISLEPFCCCPLSLVVMAAEAAIHDNDAKGGRRVVR